MLGSDLKGHPAPPVGEESVRRGAAGVRETDRRPAVGPARRGRVRGVLPAVERRLPGQRSRRPREGSRAPDQAQPADRVRGPQARDRARARRAVRGRARWAVGLALGWAFAADGRRLPGAERRLFASAETRRVRRRRLHQHRLPAARARRGAFAIAVPASRWLLVCTLLLSSLLGFGKRAHELRIGGEDGHLHREVLGDYNPRVLRALLVVLGVATTAAYLIYTRTAARHRAVRRRPPGVHGAVRGVRRLPLHPHRQPHRQGRQPHRFDAPRCLPSW